MQLSFRSQPGYWERHLARRYHNPLFTAARREVSEQELSEARRRDNDELQSFQEEFLEMLNETAALTGNVDSDVVLKLKEQADRLYEQSVGLASDLADVREALLKLVSAMMKAVSDGATGDPRAMDEVAQENAARAEHYRLLGSLLVADLLRPDSPVEQQDLLPSLMSSEEADLALALQLFNDDELASLVEQGEDLLAERSGEGLEIADAVKARLEQIRSVRSAR